MKKVLLLAICSELMFLPHACCMQPPEAQQVIQRQKANYPFIEPSVLQDMYNKGNENQKSFIERFSLEDLYKEVLRERAPRPMNQEQEEVGWFEWAANGLHSCTVSLINFVKKGERWFNDKNTSELLGMFLSAYEKLSDNTHSPTEQRSPESRQPSMDMIRASDKDHLFAFAAGRYIDNLIKSVKGQYSLVQVQRNVDISAIGFDGVRFRRLDNSLPTQDIEGLQQVTEAFGVGNAENVGAALLTLQQSEMSNSQVAQLVRAASQVITQVSNELSDLRSRLETVENNQSHPRTNEPVEESSRQEVTNYRLSDIVTIASGAVCQSKDKVWLDGNCLLKINMSSVNYLLSANFVDGVLDLSKAIRVTKGNNFKEFGPFDLGSYISLMRKQTNLLDFRDLNFVKIEENFTYAAFCSESNMIYLEERRAALGQHVRSDSLSLHGFGFFLEKKDKWSIRSGEFAGNFISGFRVLDISNKGWTDGTFDNMGNEFYNGFMRDDEGKIFQVKDGQKLPHNGYLTDALGVKHNVVDGNAAEVVEEIEDPSENSITN